MKREDINKMMENVAEDLLSDALPPGMDRTPARRPWFKPALAAGCLVLAAFLGIILWPREGGLFTSPKAQALERAAYPSMPGQQELMEAEHYWEENHSVLERLEEYRFSIKDSFGAGKTLAPFFQKAAYMALKGAGGENVLLAPVNLFLNLAILAEISEGETRREVLEALEVESIQELRETAKKVWQANYYDDGAAVLRLGSSLWMRRELKYQENTIKKVAENYYASVFRGEMGSEEYNSLYRDWIREQTGGLLNESVDGLSLDPSLIMSLVSTLQFSARWMEGFPKEKTGRGIFRGAVADIEMDFMHMTDDTGLYYYGEHFGAYNKNLRNVMGFMGSMYFILPDEGFSMDELLEDAELKAFLTDAGAVPHTAIKINLTLPKFDISAEQEQSAWLKELGVRRAFDPERADFTALIKDMPAFISQVKQGARVAVDEEGVTAAAYQVWGLAGAPLPPEEEIDFILDRPFLFLIRSEDGLPVLIAVVNQPE